MKQKILTINAGSTSLKFKVFDEKFKVLASGFVERIGSSLSDLHYITKDENIEKTQRLDTHFEALKMVEHFLLDREVGVIENVKEVGIVGHRVVHGGDITEPQVVKNGLINKIRAFSPLAPLHNPANIVGITVAKKIFNRAKHVAVFDTAFHQTMPEAAYVYPIPYILYEEKGVRRYGFHGISHEYLVERASKIIKKPKNKLNAIVCHLGAGCSMTAVQKGRSVDTSMGFTPLEGLMMGTRSGDIDPSIVNYMERVLKLTSKEADKVLNFKSGLLGVSGIGNDMRDIEKNYLTNKRAKLALDMFVYRIVKYIGAYTAVLGNVDVIVFSGGVGARSSKVRAMVMKGLEGFGVKIDISKNKKAFDKETLISTRSSKIKVLAMPTDEELMIAKKAKSL